MIFEEFAPTSEQQLERLRLLRSQLLRVIAWSGGACALVRIALML